MEIVTFADAFAERAHAGQFRKGADGTPYIVHPRAVSAILKDHYPANVDLTVAGLLHDVVEDTPITIETIEALFGLYVGSLVWAVTNTRKGYNLADGSDDALRLKTADLLANVMETQHDIEHGQFVWPRFAMGRGKVDAWDRQTALIERRLWDPLAARNRTDRDFVERLRGRVDMMKGLARIVTDEEKEFVELHQ